MISAEQLWAEKYAGLFAEEQAREVANRDQAFLNQAVDICGEELRVMTPMDLLVLSGVDNAFTCGGAPRAGDVGVFLWWLNTSNDGSNSYGNAWRKGRALRRIARLPFEEVVPAIFGYMNRVFQDAPGGGGGGDERRPLGTCFIAPLVLRVARETGWEEAAILSTPLPKLFQYLKTMRAQEQGKDFMEFTPSDQIKGDFLSELNALNNPPPPASA